MYQLCTVFIDLVGSPHQYLSMSSEKDDIKYFVSLNEVDYHYYYFIYITIITLAVIFTVIWLIIKISLLNNSKWTLSFNLPKNLLWLFGATHQTCIVYGYVCLSSSVEFCLDFLKSSEKNWKGWKYTRSWDEKTILHCIKNQVLLKPSISATSWGRPLMVLFKWRHPGP